MAYLNLYKGLPTAGGTDGSKVVTGNPIFTPYLDLASNETADIKLALRCNSGCRSQQETIINPSSIYSTLASAAAVGDTTITVSSATGFQVGNRISVGANTATPESKRITNIDSTVLTLDSALTIAQASGVIVESLSRYQIALAKDNDGEPGTYGEFGTSLTLPFLATPENLAATAATTGGSLEAGDYSYQVTAYDANGETMACNAKTITVPSGTSTNAVTLSWDAVSGATGYKVYGRAAASTLYIATVTAATYTDTGAITPAGELPTTSAVQITDTNTIIWARVQAQAAEAVPYNDTSASLAVSYKVGEV
jgi:hypothetical protein